MNQISLPICQSFQVQQVTINQNTYLQYEAEATNQYLIDDFSIEGEYFRKLNQKQTLHKYLLEIPKGILLKQLINTSTIIEEKIIIKIICQIIQALENLYKKKLMGRCFGIDNILWDGECITMMSFGFYPSISDKYSNYSLTLDSYLLGVTVYNLISLKENYNVNEAVENINNAPILNKIKEATNKLLNKIKLSEIIPYFVEYLPNETLNFFVNQFDQIQIQIEESIKYREDMTIKLITFEDKIENIQIEKFSYLLFYNKEQEEDQYIWNKLHDQLYRIYLLEKLIGILDSYQFEELIYLQIKFIIEKTKLLILKIFQQFLQNQIEQDHSFFCKTSKQLKPLKKIIKDNITNGTMIFISTYESLIEQLSENIKEEQKQSFSLDLWENNFEEIKQVYRFFILKIYKQVCSEVKEQIENSEDQIQALKKQFYVLMCLIINHVVDKKDQHFKTLKNTIQFNNNPNDIEERFINQASAKEFIEQIQEITDCYFKK